jgi:hypothetical protein
MVIDDGYPSPDASTGHQETGRRESWKMLVSDTSVIAGLNFRVAGGTVDRR